MGNKISRSIAISKESFAVLKANPTLAFLPVISGIALVLCSLPFVAAIWATNFGAHQMHSHALGTAGMLLTAALYFVNMFVVVFFNSALVACASESLQGRPTTIGYGIGEAVKKLPQIALWSLIAATVGTILRMISERAGVVGSVVSGIFGLAWNLIVFFVVPLLILENVSPIAAIKQSGVMLKQTWGERVVLGFGLSTVIFLLALVAIFPIGLGIYFLAIHLIPVGAFLILAAVMYVLVLGITGSALATIYQTALFLFSRNQMIPAGFSPETMQDAFRQKAPSTFFGR